LSRASTRDSTGDEHCDILFEAAPCLTWIRERSLNCRFELPLLDVPPVHESPTSVEVDSTFLDTILRHLFLIISERFTACLWLIALVDWLPWPSLHGKRSTQKKVPLLACRLRRVAWKGTAHVDDAGGG